MANLAKYGEWSEESAATEKEEADKSGSGAEFVKLAVGKNKLRILPPKLGQKSPFVTVWQHFIEVPGQGKPVSFACPRMMAKQFCPACSKVDELRATGSKQDYDLAGRIMAKRRVFANAVSRAEPERGVLVLGAGKQIHDQLLALRNDREAGGNFTDPGPNGFDIIIERKGTGKNDTEYKVFADRNNSALGNDEWLDTMHDLGRYAKVPTFDEIKEQMAGAAPGGGRSGRAAPTGRGARRTAADDAIDTEGESDD